MIELDDRIYKIDESSIGKIFAPNGTSPFQCPKALRARLNSLPRGDFACCLFRSGDQLIVSAFERMNDRFWRCFILSDPFLKNISINGPLLDHCLHTILKRLDAEGLYFPYIDPRSDSFPFFKALANCITIQRLPAPLIRWQENNQLFTDRIGENSKRRAHRFWKKFERRLQLRELTGEKAVLALDEIEKKSWKHHARQSMHYRDNQFAFYSDWLLRKGLFLHVAEELGKPVAYRLDAKLNRTVYALKYSYDEAYKQFSPGYYLLTLGFLNRWTDAEIETIDLWGSPDTLKNSIKTDEYERHDFLWPASPAGEKLLQERLAHDKMLSDNLNNHVGLKALFQP